MKTYVQACKPMTTLDASVAELRQMHWKQLINSELKALETLSSLQQELEHFDNCILQEEISNRIKFLEKIRAQSLKRHYY